MPAIRCSISAAAPEPPAALHQLTELRRVLKPNGRCFISDEVVDGGGCGHGDGPLSDAEAVQQFLRDNGFADVTMDIIKKDGEGIYLFKAQIA